MSSMKVERDIKAAPSVVWGIISDLDRSAEIIGAIKRLERLDGGEGFEVGTKWSETRVMFGKESTETMAVTAIDEGHSYKVESDAHGAHYLSILAVEPKADGSRLSMTFDVEAMTTSARIMGVFGKLMQGSMRKALAQDLADIAAAAEADAD